MFRHVRETTSRTFGIVCFLIHLGLLIPFQCTKKIFLADIPNLQVVKNHRPEGSGRSLALPKVRNKMTHFSDAIAIS